MDINFHLADVAIALVLAVMTYGGYIFKCELDREDSWLYRGFSRKVLATVCLLMIISWVICTLSLIPSSLDPTVLVAMRIPMFLILLLEGLATSILGAFVITRASWKKTDRLLKKRIEKKAVRKADLRKKKSAAGYLSIIETKGLEGRLSKAATPGRLSRVSS